MMLVKNKKLFSDFFFSIIIILNNLSFAETHKTINILTSSDVKIYKQIFKIHIQEFRPKTWALFDYSRLSNLSESFSGAEIRQSIIEGMHHAFYEEREFTTDDICHALEELIPLAQLENNQTLKLQKWALSGKIRSASSKDIYLT